MRTCDVLIVGGGPAGSTCARELTGAGADVVLIDRARFPRDKVCAGWITPGVFTWLRLTPQEYRAAGLVLQEMRGFRTACGDGPQTHTTYETTVSYAIRRCEFDTFLLRRSQAQLVEGTPVVSLRRTNSRWIVNDSFAAPVVVGAGGHFCPVAARIRPHVDRGLVVAREVELRLAPGEPCRVEPDTPELFFEEDLEGYGWCVRKADYLNVGIGRRVSARFNEAVRKFVSVLEAAGKAPRRASEWQRWHGHAYLLEHAVKRPPVADGLILVGDAAGLAYADSGEGIGPAIESGVLAARTLAAAGGRFGEAELWPYVQAFGTDGLLKALAGRVRSHIPARVGRLLLSSGTFTRYVLDEWFTRPSPRERLLGGFGMQAQ